MSIDWSKAPEGATAWDCRPHADKTWMRPNWQPNRGWDYWGGKHWIYYGEMPEEQERQMIHRSEQAAWTGEGMPPVGTICEFEVETNDWRKCEVIAIKDDYAVCWVHVNKIFATGGAAIRPIRTPEQIAAEERSKAIDQMRADAGSLNLYPFQQLYDAGYRKQVTK